MKLQEYLEKDRTQFTAALRKARTPEKAVTAAEEELDRLLYQYNENCEEPAVRSGAARMIQAVKAAAPAIHSVSDVKVWESTAQDTAAALAVPKQNVEIRYLAGGAGSIAAGTVLSLLMDPFGVVLSFVIPGILQAAGAVMIFLGGRKKGMSLKKETKEKKENVVQMTECIVDANRIYRILHAVMIMIDQSLEEIGEEEKQQKAAEEAQDRQASYSSSDGELALYSNLLEALYSKDGSFALERLSDLLFYLHGRDIETVDYSEDTKDWFDRMPSPAPTTETIKPALVSEGKLLKKGLAVGGK